MKRAGIIITGVTSLLLVPAGGCSRETLDNLKELMGATGAPGEPPPPVSPEPVSSGGSSGGVGTGSPAKPEAGAPSRKDSIFVSALSAPS